MPQAGQVDAKRLLRLPVIYLALFLSGAAALVYQATWGRMLHRVFGVSDQAIATVLAAFFLGLGIGAALGGRWGTRFRRPALTYAVLEAGIGAFALLSLWMIPRVHDLYAAVGGDVGGVALTIIRLAIALALLLPPTILMGATLPVLIALLATDRQTWSAPATWLYATNTVGAMVGAGLTGLYLVPQLGTRMSIVVAAVASLSGAAIVAAVWLDRRVERVHESEKRDPEEEQEEADELPDRLVLAMAIAALAGMAALASEVLWTRVLRMILVGTTQAFSAMLVNYLAGIAIGSLLAAELIRRGYRADLLLGGSQVLLAGLTVVAMTIAPQLPRLIVLMQQSQNVTPTDLTTILTVSGVLLFPIAIVLGTSIPLCWHFARSGPEKAAQHAGKILAANTLGGLAGSMVAGFGAVPLLGVELSLIFVMFLHLVIGGTVLQGAVGRGLVPRVTAVAGPLAFGMIMLSASPTLHLPFLLGVRAYPSKALLKGPSDPFWEAILFMEEGRNTTVTVLETPGKLHLYNDGRPESHFLAFDPGIGEELVVLGGLPSLYAEQRDRALVIGLGAGHTATMLLQGPWREVHVVELEEAVVHAARFMHEARNMPFPVDDPRVRLTVDDARAQLVLAEEGSLDTVVSQPSHPWLAGSSALYTQEFFREVRRALRPKGVFSLWVNLFRIQSEHVGRILATLVSVFPNVNAFVVEGSSLILVASASPLVLGAAAEERFENMGLARFLKRRKLHHFSSLVARRELDGPAVKALDLDAAPIVDDRPALEFELASLPPTAKLHVGDLDQMFSGTPWIAPASFQALAEDERLDVLLKRIHWVRTRPLALDRVERSVEALDLSAAEDAIARGALAAARGDVGTALGHFDAVEHPIAATLADQLRAHQLSFRELVERSIKREIAPKDPSALVRAAIALAEPEVMAHALSVAKASPLAKKSRLLPVLEAMHGAGCEGVLDIPLRELAATDDEYAIFLAQRCAMEAGELAQASWLGDQRARVRGVLAQEAAEAAVDHMTNGNVDAAILHFRRALSKDPGHGVAASSLAGVLASRGDIEGARRILVAAHYASRGLPGHEQIARAAAELGVPLPKAKK